MPPIRIHSDSPISATATTGQAPNAPHQQTQAPMTTAQGSAPAQPTQQIQSTSRYAPPPQPGQAPVPAPTGAPSVASPSEDVSVDIAPPTRTTQQAAEDNERPSPPQPGAAPYTSSSSNPTTYAPPQPIPQNLNPQPAAPQITTPPQLSMAPPMVNAAATKSTIPQPTPQTAYLTQSAFQASLSHPPGYNQNTGAIEMSASQRMYQEQQEQNASGAGLFSNFNPNASVGTTNAGTEGAGEMVGNAWNTAKQWIGTVGSKLEGVENEVWKRVNNEK